MPQHPAALSGLSSMATRNLLASLTAELERTHGVRVRFEAGGGVEVVRRLREGAAADLAVLADDALRELDADGLLVPASRRRLFTSAVVAAVAEGSDAPSIGSTDELRTALRRARRVVHSTGPSGAAIVRLVRDWDLAGHLAGRLVQADPGVPVGSLLRDGDLGFQQRSELAGLPGVRVLGELPGEAAVTSCFSGAVPAASRRQDEATEVLDLLGAPELSRIVVAAGLEPVGRADSM